MLNSLARGTANNQAHAIGKLRRKEGDARGGAGRGGGGEEKERGARKVLAAGGSFHSLDESRIRGEQIDDPAMHTGNLLLLHNLLDQLQALPHVLFTNQS